MLLLAGATLAFAGQQGKDADFHLDAEQARALYRASAFLHGYLHGYAQGFHCADQDIHMGRPSRTLENLEDKGTAEHRPRFGDRRLFLRGYQSGLHVGYADGIRGGEFRAIAQGRLLAQGMEAVERMHPARQKVFENGVARGYDQGLRQGLLEARNQAPYPGDLVRTAAQVTAALTEPEDHKLGFALGYRLGYADGYMNQSPEGPGERFAARK
jgi:hypothetical protein